MPDIEGSDGETIEVTIVDQWIENVHTKDGPKVVVKLKGQDEHNRHGIVKLWITDNRRAGQIETDGERALEMLEGYGMENGDVHNLIDLNNKPATFSISIKDGKTNYYLRSPVERLDVDTAAKMIEQILGKAREETRALRGEPVNGDNKLSW